MAMEPRDKDRILHQRANPRLISLWKALRPLQSVISFLDTGAHPDDETTEMLAALAYRDGFRIAFACANRGEGGQNNIGTERGADLGTLRTREMERACDEIGMGLYWLSTSPDDPIFDFGFSKSGEETFRYWGREATVAALVRIVRQERPDIVCPTFLDVPGQHGHHRAMTQAAHEAVARAADPKQFPEHIAEGLAPWQVSKLYLPAWSGGGRSYDDTEPPPPTSVSVQSGDFDPVLGATYSQIGEWSRALHKTQGMGSWIEAGPKNWPLHRHFATADMPANETSLSDGLPLSLADLGARSESEPMARLLEAASGAVAATVAVWPDFDAVARAGAVAYNAIGAASVLLTPGEAAAFGHRLEHKKRQLARIVAIAGGLDVRLTPQQATVCPGGTANLAATVTRIPGAIDGEASLDIVAPSGWTIKEDASGFALNVPDTAEPTDPYPPGYEPDGSKNTIHGRVGFSVNGTELVQLVPLEVPVHVVPETSLRLTPGAVLVNLDRGAKPGAFSIQVEDNLGDSRSRKLSLARAGGWVANLGQNENTRISIAGNGAVSGSLTRKSPPKPGLAELALKIDGQPAVTLYQGQYPHIGRIYRSAPAILRVLTLKAELRSGLRIAYIGGGNDVVDDNLRAIGAHVQSLDAETLPRADLSDFDTIVIGIFAFGSRDDLAARRGDLHEWVRGGGNLVTLYHRPWDNWHADETPPARLEIGQPSLRWRVTDASAKVTVLTPEHELVTGPNPITAADWQGWVKERGLYFASQWDEAYVPLLSMSDPDEAPHDGALLSAQIGKGRHTHTSLILHHQMDNLVPGAFRLMANLVSA